MLPYPKQAIGKLGKIIPIYYSFQTHDKKEVKMKLDDFFILRWDLEEPNLIIGLEYRTNTFMVIKNPTYQLLISSNTILSFDDADQIGRYTEEWYVHNASTLINKSTNTYNADDDHIYRKFGYIIDCFDDNGYLLLEEIDNTHIRVICTKYDRIDFDITNSENKCITCSELDPTHVVIFTQPDYTELRLNIFNFLEEMLGRYKLWRKKIPLKELSQ